MTEYSYDRQKMEDLASEQDHLMSKSEYMEAMGHEYEDGDEEIKKSLDTEYSDYEAFAKDQGKLEKADDEITDEELLAKGEEIVNEDLSSLPSDEELLAEIDSLFTSEDVSKSKKMKKAEDEEEDKEDEDDDEGESEEKEEKAMKKSEESLEKGQGDFGGDDSKETGGGYQKNSDSPASNFPGEGNKKKEKKGGDDSKEDGGGYKANSDAPQQDYPGNSGGGSQNGDDDEDDKTTANGMAPKEEFPGSTIMKSLDQKFDVLIDCVMEMNERLDEVADRQERFEKSQKDEVADEVIEKAQKEEKETIEKSLASQIADLTSTVKTVVEQNAELQKSLKGPATRRQSLSSYNQIEKSVTKGDVNSLSKSQKLRKLEQLRKSQPELGDDIIKLNSSGILTDRARLALEDAQ